MDGRETETHHRQLSVRKLKLIGGHNIRNWGISADSMAYIYVYIIPFFSSATPRLAIIADLLTTK